MTSFHSVTNINTQLRKALINYVKLTKNQYDEWRMAVSRHQMQQLWSTLWSASFRGLSCLSPHSLHRAHLRCDFAPCRNRPVSRPCWQLHASHKSEWSGRVGWRNWPQRLVVLVSFLCPFVQCAWWLWKWWLFVCKTVTGEQCVVLADIVFSTSVCNWATFQLRSI